MQEIIKKEEYHTHETVTKTREVKMFQAEDGEMFKTEDDCQKHETLCEFKKAIQYTKIKPPAYINNSMFDTRCFTFVYSNLWERGFYNELSYAEFQGIPEEGEKYIVIESYEEFDDGSRGYYTHAAGFYGKLTDYVAALKQELAKYVSHE